jgi:hypothetical protein
MKPKEEQVNVTVKKTKQKTIPGLHPTSSPYPMIWSVIRTLKPTVWSILIEERRQVLRGLTVAHDRVEPLLGRKIVLGRWTTQMYIRVHNDESGRGLSNI